MKNELTHIVIPVYNEESVIRGVVIELKKFFKNIVIVNDGSTDKTIHALSGLNLTIINHPYNMGQGAALQTGINYCRDKDTDYVITFDGDGQHSVDDALFLIKTLKQQKLDVVLGSRFMGDTISMPIPRLILLKIAILINYIFTGIKLSDAHNGLRAFNKITINTLSLKQNRMAHATEILSIIANNKLTFTEVPVTIKYTEYSLMKGQRIGNAINILMDILIKNIKS